MAKPFDSAPLRDYLSRLSSGVTHITVTAGMMKKLTGHPLRTNDWTAGELLDEWEVVDVIPKVGLALRRIDSG
jgi:hypothetical protein